MLWDPILAARLGSAWGCSVGRRRLKLGSPCQLSGGALEGQQTRAAGCRLTLGEAVDPLVYSLALKLAHSNGSPQAEAAR